MNIRPPTPRARRPRRDTLSSEQGLTLIELLVAMTIFTIVIAGAVSLFTSVIRQEPALADRSNQVGLTRVALERAIREIRQGVSVETATGSQVSMRTYVKTTCAGAPSATSVLCRVTLTCAGTTCSRTLANENGTSPRPAVTFARGINNPTSVFSYTGSPPTYVGVKFVLPTKDGRGSLTLQDGASLRNATLGL